MAKLKLQLTPEFVQLCSELADRVHVGVTSQGHNEAAILAVAAMSIGGYCHGHGVAPDDVWPSIKQIIEHFNQFAAEGRRMRKEES